MELEMGWIECQRKLPYFSIIKNTNQLGPLCICVGMEEASEYSSSSRGVQNAAKNSRKVALLTRQGQTRWPAADDQDVGFRGKRTRRSRVVVMLSRFGNLRVAGSEIH
jgi:hypothetical protein